MRWKEFVEEVENKLDGANPQIEYIDIDCGYYLEALTEININYDKEKDTVSIT
jgi:hypothetical protein